MSSFKTLLKTYFHRLDFYRNLLNLWFCSIVIFHCVFILFYLVFIVLLLYIFLPCFILFIVGNHFLSFYILCKALCKSCFRKVLCVDVSVCPCVCIRPQLKKNWSHLELQHIQQIRNKYKTEHCIY